MRLASDVCEEVARLLHERYGDFLTTEERLVVSGETSCDEVELCLLIEGPSEQVEVVVRLPRGQRSSDESREVDLALDAMDGFVGSWLEEERKERHPIDFVEYDFDGRRVLVRLRRSKPGLEAEADRLLRLADQSMEDE